MAISGEGVTIPYELELESEDTEAITEYQSLRAAHDPATSPDLISFVIPAYNEGQNIYRNLQECYRVVQRMGMPFEVIVVNDGSRDSTLLEIERFAMNHREILPVTYAKNAGKGNALKVGSKRAKGDLVVFLDADMEIHPSQIGMFIAEMRNTNADIVIGSKRHPQSKIDYPAKRKFLSWGFHLMIRTMFDLDVTDTQPGLKLFKKEVLDKEMGKVEAERYAFDLDLLVNASLDGYKIVEAPIELKFSRKFGGRVGFRTVNNIFRETMGIHKRMRAARKQQGGSIVAPHPNHQGKVR